MNKDKTGLIVGGLLLAAGAGVGGYFLWKSYKGEGSVSGMHIGTYYGDWNTNQINAWREQQARLFAQRHGVTQTYGG